MKSRQNKGNKPANSKSLGFQNREGEYDLWQNLHRVNSLSRGSRQKSQYSYPQTESTRYEDDFENTGAIKEIVDTSPQTKTGGMSWDTYLRLDDKITNFDEKNNLAHNELRRELEVKIKEAVSPYEDRLNSIDHKLENRISNNTFYWVIGGLLTILCVIVGIWWSISYSDIYQLPQDINKIKSDIEQLKNSSVRVDTLQYRNHKSK